MKAEDVEAEAAAFLGAAGFFAGAACASAASSRSTSAAFVPLVESPRDSSSFLSASTLSALTSLGSGGPQVLHTRRWVGFAFSSRLKSLVVLNALHWLHLRVPLT